MNPPHQLRLLMLITAFLWGVNFAVGAVIRAEVVAASDHLCPVPCIRPVEPRLVLALSGGGARGLAHIGVLEVLDSAGIPVGGIAGTSAGALVGALYAGGLRPSEIVALFLDVRWEELLLDEPERRSLSLGRKQEHSRHLVEIRFDRFLSPIFPGALTSGQRLYDRILQLTFRIPHRGIWDWNRLEIPLVIQATDLTSGAGVPIQSGDFATALRGSMSLPLMVDPMPYGKMELIDGGISANIPVDAARRLGGDVVMAVDVTAALEPLTAPIQPWEVVNQVTSILQQMDDSLARARADIVVKPALEQFRLLPGDHPDSIIAAGREAMRRQLPKLIALLKPDGLPDDSLRLRVEQLNIISNPPGLLDFAEIGAKWHGEFVTISEVRKKLREIIRRGDVRDCWAEYDEIFQVLTVYADPHPVVNKIEAAGSKVILPTESAAVLERLVGKPFNCARYHAALTELLALYRRRGYPAARLINAEFERDAGILKLTLDDGVLTDVTFNGLKRVPEQWLRREVPIQPGALITSDGAMRGAANLYSTGLFRTVYPVIEPEGGRAGSRLRFIIKEHPSPPVRLGLAYLGEQHTRGFVELTWPNPFNYAARAVLFSSVGERDRHHQLSFLADKVYGMPLTTDFSLYYRWKQRSRRSAGGNEVGDYELGRWGGSIEMGGQAPSWGRLTATLRREVHANRFPADGSPPPRPADGESDYSLTAVGAHLTVDTEDRFPYPREGVRLDVRTETARPALGSEREFNRIDGTFESFVTHRRRHTFGLRLAARTADRTTPFDELFALGDMHTFPGLHLDELIGTMQMTGGVEWRYDLLSRLLADAYIGVRFDVGGSWDDPAAQIRHQDWQSSATFYLAFDTVFGPIHLQWSRLMPSPDRPGRFQVLIQAGNYF